MKLKTMFEIAIAEGRRNDPRGQARVRKEMEVLREAYGEMSKRRQKTFDEERLDNPYADSRILYGNPSMKVKGILVGVDIDVGEIVLADRLRERGKKIDLVLSHHPAGRAYAGFYKVMGMQADILHNLGIPINITEALIEERMKEVEQKVMPANHARVVDAARLLDVPLACVHTPADNCVATFLQRLFDRKKPETLRDIIDIIGDIPEYRRSIENNCPPKILAGAEGRRAGRVFVDMTGGTEGPVKIIEKLAQAGVGTLVGMHFSAKHLQEAKNRNVNVIVAGHIASDAVGINILLDAVCRKEKLAITPCSGFERVTRKKSSK